MKKLLAISIFILPFINAAAQDAEAANVIMQQGNEWFRQKQYAKAEQAYRDALEKDKGNTTATYNLSDALYFQGKATEAIKVLDELVMNTDDAALKGKAHYNKGAILSAQKKLEESIESYKNALRNNPADKEARENLQKALIELKKKTPPPTPKENKKQQQKQQPQKMNQKEAEQQLKLLEQKEKEVQQRLQQEKSKNGSGQQKDW